METENETPPPIINSPPVSDTPINPMVMRDGVGALSTEQKEALFELWALLIHTLVHNGAGHKEVASFEQASRTMESLRETLAAEPVQLQEQQRQQGKDRFKSAESVRMMRENPLSEEFWSQAGAGDMDGLVLRFLRARKWNVRGAYEMLVQCLRWRREIGVRRIMAQGESALNPVLLTSGESYFWKHDREGRLVIVMRGRLHDRGAQTHADMVAFTVYQIETGRRLMGTRQDTVTLVFDLGDAPLSSFDYGSIQFIVQAMQSYYPESLGKCLLVNAPWLFSGFWRLIRPLLDPVVAAKVHFLGADQMVEHFDKGDLQVCYGGQDTYEYLYEPLTEHHRYLPPLDESEWTRLQQQIEQDKVRLVDLTLSLDSRLDEELLGQRERIKESLRRAQCKLDQHAFARGHYHRVGVLDDEGNVHWPQ